LDIEDLEGVRDMVDLANYDGYQGILRGDGYIYMGWISEDL